MVNAAGIAGVSQDFNGQGRKLDEVSLISDHPRKVLNISLTTGPWHVTVPQILQVLQRS